MLLNNFKNKNAREEIEDIANSSQMLYFSQLEKLILLIETLMNDSVDFIPTSKQNIKIINENLNKGGDILLIPKNNLLSELDNKKIYYSKLADELIRYNRIKHFMFKPKMFLSFTDLQYNLSDDEIILLQSLLTQDYFDDLVPDHKSKYVSFTSYNTVEPNTSQVYDNNYDIISKKINDKSPLVDDKPVVDDTPSVVDNKLIGTLIDKEFKVYNNCPIIKKEIYAKLKLKFRGGYKEIIFSSENSKCSFDVALTLINNNIDNKVDINDIK